MTDEQRRAVLVELEERHRVLEAERATIDEELSSIEAIVSGHRAALAH